MEIDINVILQKALDFAVRFIKELITAPQIIWEWSQKSTLNRVIMFAAAAAAVVLLIAAVISTIRGLVKWNKFSLSFFWFVVLLICVGMWFARGQIVARQIPESAPVRINGVDVLANKQYSLARGRMIETESSSFINTAWSLIDDTLSLKINDDTIIQLTDMHSFLEDRTFFWREWIRYTDSAMLKAACDYKDEDGENAYAYLDVFIYPNAQLYVEEWYLDPGEKIEASTSFFGVWGFEKDGTSHILPTTLQFEILENSGDRVVALVNYPSSEEVMVFMGQQIGPDLVTAVSRAYNAGADKNGIWYTRYYKPDTDLQKRELMLEPLKALFNGRMRLLKDLTVEQQALILPDRIVDYPIGFSMNTDHFSIPCSDLFEIGYRNDEYSLPVIRFRGTGPDGKEYLYSLFNEADTDEHDISAEIWKEKPDVDAEMSEFIGAKAYIYHDGWLLKMGNTDPNGNQKQYYYLTMEHAD